MENPADVTDIVVSIFLNDSATPLPDLLILEGGKTYEYVEVLEGVKEFCPDGTNFVFFKEVSGHLVRKGSSFVGGRYKCRVTCSPPIVCGKTIGDGIPDLEKIISISAASIPPEDQHASCGHTMVDCFFLLDFPEKAKQFNNRVWGEIPHGLPCLTCTTEDDVVGFVKIFLRDIVNSLGLSFNMAIDFGIKHVAPDVCIFTYGDRLVGVVEIKKPEDNILTKPTVLGELFDQMILVEGFYMSGPVIGILTTLSEWEFCWFPADTAHFSTHCEPFRFFSTFLTPEKAPISSSSPPRNTPSRTNRWSHGIEVDEDGSEDFDDFELTEIERSLCTSPVINAHTQYDQLLRYLYTAFTRMTQVRMNHRSGFPRSLFELHKGEKIAHKITFHNTDYIPVSVDSINSNKFPRSNTKTLLALEDLGRGSTGKAWLCCTLSRSPALCVLKFGNKKDSVDRLIEEKAWWDKVYPEFAKMTKLEWWGGSIALMMPHFCTIPDEDRHDFKDSIRSLLVNKFYARGFQHKDIAWRNFGFYVDKKSRDKTPVLFDLERMVTRTPESDDQWIEDAMAKLFENN